MKALSFNLSGWRIRNIASSRKKPQHRGLEGALRPHMPGQVGGAGGQSMQVLRDEAAFADWEGEGGIIRGAPREPGGPPEQLAECEAVFGIDQDLSYLGLSCLTCGEAPEKAAGHGTNYVEARGIWYPYLTVERFSFLLRMRDLFRERRASTGRLAASIGITAAVADPGAADPCSVIGSLGSRQIWAAMSRGR